MTLAEMLEGRFRGDVRFRGAAYLQAERVAVTRVTADNLFAVVRDGVEYQTQLARQEGSLKLNCSCAQPSTTTNGSVQCKHVWATVLAADAGHYLSGSVKPGYIPPFTVETEALDLELDDDWDLDDPGELQLSRAPTRRARVEEDTPIVISAPLKAWESRLSELRQSMQDSDGASSTSARERQIFYEIDAAASDEAGTLIIQTSQRQRRANGDWGKLKPLKLKPGRFEEIDDDEDRRILAHLIGGTPDRSNWSAQAGETWAAVHRYRVPYDLCQLLLPAICASGRVRLAGDEERATDILEWDAGEPWELTLSIENDAVSGMWRLKGWLVRGDDRVPLPQPVLLVPGGLFVTATTICRFQDFDAFPWVGLLRRDNGIEVANGEEHDLVDRLLDMPALPRLDLPTELKLQEVVLEPKPTLLVHPPAKSRWQQDRLKGEVLFEYDGTDIRGSSGQWAVVQRSAGRCLIRHRELESDYWNQVQDAGFRRLIDQRRGQHDVEIPSRDLGPAVRTLMQQGWSVRAEGKRVRQPLDIRFQVQSGIDWFELHAEIDFEGSRVGFPELLAALARGDSTVVLDDGSLGILPEEWLKRYGLLAGLGVTEEDHLRFSAVQVGLLDALLSTQPSVDFDARFLEVRDRLSNFAGITPVTEGPDFHGELRHYQRDGLGWLQFLEEFQFGGCLADDMGLGKTIQMLAFFNLRKKRRTKKLPSLIVVPKSLMFNWRQECEKFTPLLSVMEYSGIDRGKLRDEFEKRDLILTTYGTLRRDVLALKEQEFDYVVLDEAQAIKNSGSQVAKAARLLRSRHRVALSGTPIENHLGDLCSIFEFLNPSMLGRSSAFRLHAADPTDRETRRVLADGLRPLILRRTKQSVASELPEKLEQTIYCEMGAEQEKLYNELRDHYRDSLLGMIDEGGMAKAKMHVLEALLRLRQAACHPALLHKGAAEDSSAKLDALCPQLQELIDEGHKALVFSQFTSMLAIVRQHLDKQGIVYEYLDGQTRDRKERVEHFQSDPNCGVFLISLKAGGLGLNLTAADYVFILDPWWNPAVETQAIDRAHRVGQTRPVFAYRLICKGTVEEKITELQQVKRELADAILEQDGTLLQNLTTEDLQQLLS
ncbi:MAG TPA: DEAD/DEAH box helicase [Planctomycetaceae bacterium]|nr:DEAD/DEAH box helicase [Planctomycetaceae bacterium]